MSTQALEVRNVTIRYGRVEAVRNVSMSVQEGQIVSIIGANGAGKSTLLNALMGVLPLEGHVGYCGVDCTNLSVEERVRAGLVLIPERRELFGSLTVQENLVLGAFTRPAEQKVTIEAVFSTFPRLRERRRQRADTLSGGERQMLAMGRALMAHPRVLMLDEPSLGLAPRIVADILDILVGLKERGIAIILVEQNARAALRVSDHAYVMEHGRFTFSGAGADVARNPRVEEVYMGVRRREQAVMA